MGDRDTIRRRGVNGNREGGRRVPQQQVRAWEGLGEVSSLCQSGKAGEAMDTPLIRGDPKQGGGWKDGGREGGQEGMSHFLGQGEGMTHTLLTLDGVPRGILGLAIVSTA